MLQLEPHPRGVILPVRAHAASRRNTILDERDGMLRVAVTEAPERGKANKAIVAVLSRALGVSKSSIELLSGETSVRKKFLVVGSDAEALREALTSASDD